MKYEEAIEFIEAASLFGSKLGLENIRYLLDLLGNPQDDIKFVHVAGTNGKGSVCSYITRVLMEAGYRTGLFTSPYLEKFTERIQVDLINIPDDKLIEYVVLLKEKIGIMIEAGQNHPTFFELNTAISMLYFRDMKCDIAVLETGLGGRLDSTNIIKDPIVSVITAIGLDHTAILGDTIPQIAYEKAGIIKPSRPVVVYGDNPDEAIEVFRNFAGKINSSVIIADMDGISNIINTETGYSFDYKNIHDIKISLLGRHQIKNAVTSLEALNVIGENGFNISEDDIKRGLEKTKWPGRVEILQIKPTILCDATHNPHGAAVLRKTLEERFDTREIVYVMGVMKDKDYNSMAALVLHDAKAVITVRPNWHRALDAAELLETVRIYCKNSYAGDTIEEGLKKALEIAGSDGVICTFGSLYYIADVKKFVRERLSGTQGID
ncbi:MAG: bifunctional folylpolyglutamate synthase/dihydrofolate synthase [Clostridia bacterium]|nr:bifunctional folylpolyglutamate synthase/dihydrofolate synthase [Clostridia bacterium]MBN2882546.1 bifunctional folylpolyglutamate synthase/dihydrofolate synthase [Clostridia bacterium]